jgi:hypothetical protein
MTYLPVIVTFVIPLSPFPPNLCLYCISPFEIIVTVVDSPPPPLSPHFMLIVKSLPPSNTPTPARRSPSCSTPPHQCPPHRPFLPWAANAQLMLMRQQPGPRMRSSSLRVSSPTPTPSPTQTKQSEYRCSPLPVGATADAHGRHPRAPLHPWPWAMSAQGKPMRQPPDPNESQVKRRAPPLQLLQRQRRKHAAQADVSAAQP